MPKLLLYILCFSFWQPISTAQNLANRNGNLIGKIEKSDLNKLLSNRGLTKGMLSTHQIRKPSKR